jgi:hypothetical protein
MRLILKLELLYFTAARWAGRFGKINAALQLTLLLDLLSQPGRNCIPLRSLWHEEEALPAASFFPKFSNVALFFFIGMIVTVFAFIFHYEITAIFELANEIRIKTPL